jgi:hypothetical protein
MSNQKTFGREILSRLANGSKRKNGEWTERKIII